MVDVFLLVVAIVIFLLLFIIGLYLLVHFSHPDDKADAYLPKFIVVLGFVLSGSVVLALPLDVANRAGYPGCDGYDTKLCGGLNMTLTWEIMYTLVLVWLVFLIPFSTFYYESDDGTLMAGTSVGAKQQQNSRMKEAMKYEIFLIVIVTIASIVLYLLLNETKIPVEEYIAPSLGSAATYSTSPIFVNGTLQSFSKQQLADVTMEDTVSWEETIKAGSRFIQIDVSIITFFTAMMAFVGWFFFALFGGVGLAALPLDLIIIFKKRPRHLDPAEMAEAQIKIRDRVNELVDIGEMIKIEQEEEKADDDGVGKKGFFGMFKGKKGVKLTRKQRKERKKTLAEFKQAVFILEGDVEDFKACTTSYNDYNPIIPFAALFFGVISILLSLCWVLQICLYIVPKSPIDPLLNRVFRWFDSWFPLFGVLSVAIFSFYLLICAIKGCFKFGLRFFFFTIHPMTPNKTYMTSFLFNIGLLLLCSIPVVQFSIDAFADYARNTTALQVFGTQIRYMKFFSFFFENNVFVYAFLAMFGLTSIYLGLKPIDKAVDGQKLKENLESRT